MFIQSHEFYTLHFEYCYLTGGTNQMVEFQSNLLSLGFKGTIRLLSYIDCSHLQLSKFNNDGLQ